MTKTYSLPLTLAFSCLLGACVTDGDVAGVGVRAVTGGGDVPASPSELTFTDDGGNQFAIESAYLHLRDIELDLPDGLTCADIASTLSGADCEPGDDKIVITGPLDIDLVAGTATPSLAAVEIPAGQYERIDFRVDDNAQDTSFAVVADFERDMLYTLNLNLDFSEDIRIESPLGVSVDAGTDLIAEFVVGDWLAGIDVGSCMDAGDVTLDGSTVTIDDDSSSGACSDIENIIKDNMKNSGQLDRQ